jgi:hypothetical protein
MFKARHPQSELKLVMASAAGANSSALARAVRIMGLSEHVAVVDAEKLDSANALLPDCLALIAPALEPGLALRLFDALEFSKPILCSDAAGWPDVIRQAALTFDPKKPHELVQVLERVAGDNQLVGELAERSHRQAKLLGGPRDAAENLLHVFQEVLDSAKRLTNAIKGVYPDGWTHARLQITCASATEPRRLKLMLQSPRWFPWGFQRVRLLKNRHTDGRFWKLKRGGTLIIDQPLPREGGTMEVLIDPPVIPKALGINDDCRILGCLCCECTIMGIASNNRLSVPA